MVTVPEGFVRSCAFLCQEATDAHGNGVRIPKATGFFVRVPSVQHPTIRFDYFVTARHCLAQARAEGQPLWVRVATEAGLHEQPSEIEDWYEHDSADAAAILMLPTALPSGLTQADLRQSSLRVEDFVPADYIWRGEPPGMSYIEIKLAVGEDICFTGLFTGSYGGHTTNLPIARFGRISRMPSEVPFRSGEIDFKLVAYLVEATSFGGFSGSPVFFIHPTDLVDEENPGVVASTAMISGFLGLITGHFPWQSGTKEDEPVTANSGIAIVTPAEAVRELLFRDDVVEQRDRLAKGDFARAISQVNLGSAGEDEVEE